MTWPQFFAQLAAQIAVSGVTLAAVAYLLKSLVAQQLAKDLEAFKRQLAVEAERDRVRFSRLHERRAEVIEEVYKRLAHIMAMLQLQGEHSTNTGETADHLSGEVAGLSYYFRQHALYFSAPVKDKFHRMFVQGLPKPLLLLRGIGELEKYETQFKERLGQDIDLTGPFLKGLKEQLPVLTQLVQELETEFQTILGVPQHTPADQSR